MTNYSRSTRFPKRNSPKRESYDRVLIVIEGSNTELYYFEALRDQLRLSTANIEVDPKSDSAPSSVVKYAKKLYEKSRRSGSEFDRSYDKGDLNTFREEVIPLIHTAVENAKRANVAAKRNDTDNPSTEVNSLVEYLQNLKRK